jgi:2-iminobutanoate/2-iminopropanoate deaminase
MSDVRVVDGPGLPVGLPFSLAAGTDDTCFISGMPALDGDGHYQPGTFDEELALAWHNVVQIADAAGFAPHEIVYVQCVMADIDEYAALNDWWRRVFSDGAATPARFTFQAAALPFGCKIEIQAVAARRQTVGEAQS